MSLQPIRRWLNNLTPDQHMLIGDACLALTEEEKIFIRIARSDESLRGAYISLTDTPQEVQRRRVFIAAVQEQEAQKGAEIGAIIGALLMMYFAPATTIIGKTFVIAQGGIIGHSIGEHIGNGRGEEVGRHIYLQNRFAREEGLFTRWKTELLITKVFPVLAEFVEVGPDFECPITHDWIRHPVRIERSQDTHIYEKEDLLNWLRRFEDEHPLQERQGLPPEERNAIERLASPHRICYIIEADLRPDRSYHQNLVDRMRQLYNERVNVQKRMTAEGVTPRQVAQIAQQNNINQLHAEEITTFYLLRSQAERDRIAEQMCRMMRQADVADEELVILNRKIRASAEIPTLV